MSERTIWWDNFEDSPTSERDTAAPPERYTAILISGDAGYLEIWSVTDAHSGKGRLQIAYTEDQRGKLWQLRTRAEEEHQCKLASMVRWYVPENHYNQILQRLGLYDGEIPETEEDRIMRRLKENLNGENYLVNKWAAITAINDALAKYVPFLRQDQEGIPFECAAKIKELPPAEPQIRHCRECKWWDAEAGSNKGFCHAAKHCYMSGTWDICIYRKTEAEFFCGDAEAPDPEEEEEENEDE